MLINYISLLPEFMLILNVVVMGIVHLLRDSQTPKTFCTINQWFIGITAIGCLIFYNISFSDVWYVNTTFTTFFKELMWISFWWIGTFCGKWFLSKNYSSFKFYQYTNLIIFGFCVALSCRHIGLLSLALLCVWGNGCFLLMMSEELTDGKKQVMRVLPNILGGAIILGIISAVFYFRTGSLFYAEITAYYQKMPLQYMDYAGVCLMTAMLLSLLGAAPFHFDRLQVIKDGILPVSTFVAIIPPTAGLGIIIMFFHEVFGMFSAEISVMMYWSGIFSVFLGAIGTGSVSNIRQIFACIGLFYTGVVLLLLSYLTQTEVQAGIIYFLIYLLSSLGMYSCLYGIRSHGEYLKDLEDLSGMYTVRPYISSALLIFNISLFGIPPFLGLLGNLSLVNNLLIQHNLWLILYIFIMLVFLAYGLLRVIKIIYFNKKIRNFDRVDKGVYWSLLLNLGIMLMMVISPKYIMYDIEKIIYSFLG